jgi:hypothetical protein
MAIMKPKRPTYNPAAITALSEEFEVSTTFVRQSIRKEKHSRTAQNIEKKYHEINNASLQKIKELKTQLK